MNGWQGLRRTGREAWEARRRAWQERQRAWRNRLRGRDPRLLYGGLVAGAGLLFLLFYALLWQPVHSAHARLEAALDGRNETLLWMRQKRAEAERMGASRKRSDSRSISSRINLTLSEAQIEAARIRPDGKERASVVLNETPFRPLLNWLVKLRDRYGIYVSDAYIERGDAQGLVNARLTLER